jgi:hypothetical protein
MVKNNIIVISRRNKTQNFNNLLLLVKELELAIALSSVLSPGQSKQLQTAILKLVNQFSSTANTASNQKQ